MEPAAAPEGRGMPSRRGLWPWPRTWAGSPASTPRPSPPASARSPVKRAKRRGLLRNVAVALGNSGDRSKRPVLERLAQDEDPLVREHAEWALRRLGHPRED